MEILKDVVVEEEIPGKFIHGDKEVGVIIKKVINPDKLLEALTLLNEKINKFDELDGRVKKLEHIVAEAEAAFNEIGKMCDEYKIKDTFKEIEKICDEFKGDAEG